MINRTDIGIVFRSFAGLLSMYRYDELTGCNKRIVAKYSLEKPLVVSGRLRFDILRKTSDS